MLAEAKPALATAVAMRLGLQRTSHLDGGFSAWKDSGFEIVPYSSKSSKNAKS